MRNQLATGLAAMTLVGSMLGAPLATGAQASAPTTKTNAADDAIRSDLKSLASEMETYLTDIGRFPGSIDVQYDDGRHVVVFTTQPRKKWGYRTRELTLTRGDRLKTIKLSKDGLSYCLRVIRADDASPATARWRFVTTRTGVGSGVSRGLCPDRFVTVSYPQVRPGTITRSAAPPQGPAARPVGRAAPRR